jgi:hypothetical protein
LDLNRDFSTNLGCVRRFSLPEKNKAGEAKQPRYLLGGAIGGIIGSVVGIALVEFAGYSYPLPFILFFLGMAAGQLVGYLYQKRRE